MAEETQKSETAKREEEILEFWKENKTFERSLEKPAPKGEFVFYDGPPFATGLPHHGSLLSSIIKDVIPRYKTMRGYKVRRRWGWDTHGLPIENLVEKELGLKSKKEIEEIGIAKFNETARSFVLRYVADWKKYIDRIGRWVDYENSYKTMDNSYIESVWWALKQLWDKELLYEGRKVLMYCPHCETPLAKAEIAADNTYKDITEEAVTVEFERADKLGTILLAWTTTPWTLPGNVALAVHKDATYVVALQNGKRYILAKDRLSIMTGDYTIEKEVKGEVLLGKSYKPLFPYSDLKYKNHEKAWRIYHADFVTMNEGTGIVHIATMYGEDDFILGQKEGLPMVQLLNPNGTYNSDAPEFLRSIYLRDANKDIKKDLQERGLLFARDNHTHSYPHCWRCGTPLIYNAVSSWFINIQKVKSRLLAENQKVNWVPEHLKNGRFGKIVESAPDWTISRNRFWASPLPIWKSKEGKVMVIGSVDELKKRAKKSGNRYFVMRHGECIGNVEDFIDSAGDPKNHLTEKGKAECVTAARNLPARVDIIIASPLLRAEESANIMKKELGLESAVITDERLREVDMGDLSGTTFETWHAKYPESIERFVDAPKGGETYGQVKKRMAEALLDLEQRYSGKTILIISHATPLWMLKAFARGASKEETIGMYATEYPEKGSVSELVYATLPVNAEYELDLHRPYTDSITLLDDEGREYDRIKEVVDCWVESGAMPFAEYHYPFENKDVFEKRAPGDFIAEYIAQTRTWFYYMHAIGVLLFDRIAFRNVVTTGTITAADGQKISKSKNNYTDPLVLIDQYGSDAIRLYLMGSPVMQAEDLRFRDEDVRDAHNRVIGILWNSYKFFDLYQKEYDGTAVARQSPHVLDTWVLALLDETTIEMTSAFDTYDTPRAVRAIREFVDKYSTWYVRRSRERVKSEWHDRQFALAVQREVLLALSRLIAPIMPFLAESIWRGIEGGGSVHLAEWPKSHRPKWGYMLFGRADTPLKDMEEVRAFVTKALEARDKAGIKVRQPLLKLTIGSTTMSKELRDIIREEVNVKEVALSTSVVAGEVVLDTEITPELKEEGFVRDLIRAIQGARKEAGMSPHDTAALTIDCTKEVQELIDAHPEITATTHTTIHVGSVETAKQRIGAHDISLSVSALTPRT